MRKGKLLRNIWADYSWFIIILLGLISLVLGYIGFWKNSLALEVKRTFLDNLYLTLGLISLNSGAVPPPISWELQVARFLVPAVTAYTAFLAFTTIFIQQTDRVRLWFLQDHIIICGLGRKGYRLASQFLQSGNQVVVIEVDEGNDWIGNIRSLGGIVILGDARDPDLMEKVRLNRATTLISVLGDDGNNAQVAVNAEIISRARKLGCLACTIHIFDAQLWKLLREKELQSHLNPHFRLDLFNIFSRGAHLMVQNNPPWTDLNADRPPHVLIAGLGKMGQQVVLETARGWKLQGPDPDRKINFTLIDMDAKKKLAALLIQHPRLENLAVFNTMDMEITSGDFDRIAEHFLDKSHCGLDQAYICFDDETLSLQTGLRLNNQLRNYQVPIVMRMVESGGLAQLVGNTETDNDDFNNVRIFDLLDQTCTAELLQRGTHEVLARNLHGVYLEISRQAAVEDDALVAWDELSEYLKEKNRQQADRIPLMLAAAGYRIAPLRDWDAEEFTFPNNESGEDEVLIMAEMEHEYWCREKIEEGWRYGPQKDQNTKTNPSLVPWEELPEMDKDKNILFIKGLPRLLVRAGFQIERG